MGEWKEYRLEDLVFVNQKSISKDFEFDEIEYLDTGSITMGKIESYQRIKIKESPSRAKRLLKANDIVYSTVRPIQRHYGLLRDPKPNTVVSTGFAVITCNEQLADQNFIYYYLTQDDIVNYLDSVAEGSTTAYPSLTPDVITNLELFAPDLLEQKSIASILSSLDDKIDLLHRQNKTLETLAETLFQQWFVEKADESWEEKSLDELIYFNPSEKIDRSKEYTFYDMRCLSDNSMCINEGEKRIVSSATSFRNDDVLLAKITPCLENGKTGFVMHLQEKEVARGSTEFIVMRSKGKVNPYYVYCLSRSSDFREGAILSMTGTSGRQRVQIDLLKNYSISYDENRIEEFGKMVKQYFNKIKMNQNQIRTLTLLRDTLLPKLMSGEVRV